MFKFLIKPILFIGIMIAIARDYYNDFAPKHKKEGEIKN